MITAFITGIATALTPCTIVIIPIFLYRFGIWGKDESKILFKDIFLTIFGFMISLMSVGIIFEYVINSNIFNAVRLILGTLFIILGVLQIFNKLNINIVTKSSNSFVLGLLFPWVLSFSPCVLPIFTAFLSSQISTGQIIIKLLVFGLGVLTPAILISVIGNRLFEIFKKGSKAFYLIEKFSGVIIVLSGIYLNFQLLDIKSLDIAISSMIFLFIIIFSAYLVFIKQRRINLANILMFLSFLILWGTFSFNCYNEAMHRQTLNSIRLDINQYSCVRDNGNCKECMRCAKLFSLSAILGSIGFVISLRSKNKS